MSNLRNGNVNCHDFSNFHVNFKIVFMSHGMAYVMSIICFLMSIGSMSHVDFRNRPCHPVEFKCQGPSPYQPGVGDRLAAYTMRSLPLSDSSENIHLVIQHDV